LSYICIVNLIYYSTKKRFCQDFSLIFFLKSVFYHSTKNTPLACRYFFHPQKLFLVAFYGRVCYNGKVQDQIIERTVRIWTAAVVVIGDVGARLSYLVEYLRQCRLCSHPFLARFLKTLFEFRQFVPN